MQHQMRSFVKKCAPLLGRNLQKTKMLGCQHDVLLSGTVQQRLNNPHLKLLPAHPLQAPLLGCLKPVVLQQGPARNLLKILRTFPMALFTSGIVLTKVQANRIMSHKTSSLVVKETAQAIWTQSGLAMRSVKGGVAPRKRGTAETAKPRLTPEKVEVVAATLEHWGKVNKNDIRAAMKNLTNILCEKIQDCVKSERRQQLTQQALL
ncbi:hypothetical protein V5799_011655 [Amblyomma americanum]|uniref:BEN domain-containing protein n=1 Tax=Amblyomma americanum TaxID=6943 RepID=A0AAQ4EGJ1_AMBAM